MRKRERVPEAERGEFFDSLNEIQRVFHSETPPVPEAEAEPEAGDAPEGGAEAEDEPKDKDRDPPA